MTGSADKPSERCCHFCGEPFTPTRKESREHVFAERFSENFLTDDPADSITHKRRIGLDGEVVNDWSTPKLSLVAKNVCEPCNNGWMNQLDSDAEPFLQTLLDGNGREFHRQGQTLLAAWAMKICLAARLTVTHDKRIPASHYRELANLKNQPPAHVQVWLGAYLGKHGGMYQPGDIQASLDGAPPVDGYCDTMVFGHALFQVCGSPLDAPMHIIKRGTREKMSTQIWPVQGSARFPPEVVVTDDVLSFFIDQWDPPGSA